MNNTLIIFSNTAITVLFLCSILPCVNCEA